MSTFLAFVLKFALQAAIVVFVPGGIIAVAAYHARKYRQAREKKRRDREQPSPSGAST
jgi:hypothetical protein